MPIDLGKINTGNTSDTSLHPREIFTALPGKKEGKFEYPRDVQTQVWDHWFSRRNEKDLVVKMNTGSGKTVVGLLILKSCLNEGKGSAVYVVPDKYLVKQVIDEAKDLGIEVTNDTSSPRFLSGKAILVINIYKLVNGKSVFGVGDEGIKINIGSIIIDDAHACLDTVEDQFMLTIDSQNPAYKEIYQCFKESLRDQCLVKESEINNRERDVYMQVPFWSWQSKIPEISQILIKNKNTEWLKFVWPLIKESLALSRCVVSSDKIEISPHCIPIDMIPSITNARRKIFMTATLVDDSILSSHFGITEESINRAVIPNTAGDIGDRMILLPQVINTKLTDDEIKQFCKSISQDVNVVVIVPSDERAKYWKDQADQILNKDNLYEGVTRLKKEKVGLTILVNRYDGVDLPKDACRFIVIDGLPVARRLIDKVEQVILMGSSRKATQLVQKIEQGMGRGVRSSDDYCVVFLMGRNLTSQLYAGGAIDKFSPGTKAQINLSNQISEQIKGEDLPQIREAIMYCLHRNQDWVSKSKGALAALSYEESSTPDLITIAQRKTYNFAAINNYNAAVSELRKVVNTVDEKPLKSYLKQCLAEYINFYDPAEAQRTLMSAASDNSRVTKPMEGISYHKLESKAMDQARICGDYLRQKFDDPNKIVVEMYGLLESLIFKPETADIFEESLKTIARYIGFNSQRPEAEYRKGPDVLWEVGNLSYFVIECKNGATTDTINKGDCNQLNGSGEWFTDKYDETCRFTPILVHPSVKFEYAATPKEKTRIINGEKLNLLRENISHFINALCVDNKINDDRAIRERLMFYKLTADRFCENYTTNYTTKFK
ncbi:DEAD/DEAH box helicase family protein [Cylindrospermum sp. FACHB-282]|uniref:DEAD/DEAH box helicase family protein n=1 Tax=Cylindrospermum sp. FACHB-282 TaxID=2692794 RepID=UPI00168488E6|nr:DEAD/DEAH box helicase family protein [Cylindrospermum sp. FACHB-282]MBD2386175.1 DEAD/DEAH box helicase family protein [Cylindrospermum sp. FACHB-282]